MSPKEFSLLSAKVIHSAIKARMNDFLFVFR